MRHQVQGFEQYPLVNACAREEETFLKTARVVYHRDIPADANVINSHTLYKVKQNDGSLKLKVRIAPHGNEDDLKTTLSKDCATCPPTGLRILESIASLFGWALYKADVKAAFLETGAAERDVYVKPPVESRMRATHVWLLLTAAYGLVNANAKWQSKSDAVMLDLGLQQSKHIPQLFFKKKNEELVLVAAKVVNDLKASGKRDNAKDFLTAFDRKFKFGAVNHGPGHMRYFGIKTIQHEDFSIATNADDKLEAIDECYISRNRRKESAQPINAIERSSFVSINSSIGWIRTTACPICTFYSSYIQQKTPYTQVHHLVEQTFIIRRLKKLGSTILYLRPDDEKEYELSVFVFADASRVDDAGQLGVVTGLLVVPMEKGSIYHVLSWISHKAKPPVCSIPAAELFAAAEGIDDGKVVCNTYNELLCVKVKLCICVDSKDLFSSLSAQKMSIDKSIRGDVSFIRYEFQTGAFSKTLWIPCTTNIVDLLTMFTGKLTIDYSSVAETQTGYKNYD